MLKNQHNKQTIEMLCKLLLKKNAIVDNGKASVGKSIDMNLASSATSTPINCKSMNGFKDGAPNGSVHDSSVKKSGPAAKAKDQVQPKPSNLKKRAFNEISE